MYKISHSDKLLKTQIKKTESFPLASDWNLFTPFCLILLHSYPKPNVFFFFLHCNSQPQASSKPSEKEWSTYDTTVFLQHLHNNNNNNNNNNSYFYQSKSNKQGWKWLTFTSCDRNSSFSIFSSFEFYSLFSVCTVHVDLSSPHITGMFVFFLVYTLQCFHSLHFPLPITVPVARLIQRGGSVSP